MISFASKIEYNFVIGKSIPLYKYADPDNVSTPIRYAMPSQSHSIAEKYLRTIRKTAQSQKFPEDKIQELSAKLDRAITKLGEPLKHHHHIPKIIWITASLFLLLCIAAIGWRVTSASLKVYMANDVKYRKLELTKDSASLVYLWRLDSIYTANPDSLENYVTEQERLKRQREELIDHVHLLEKRIDTSAGKLGSPKDN
jgi:hypothetical protein